MKIDVYDLYFTVNDVDIFIPTGLSNASYHYHSRQIYLHLVRSTCAATNLEGVLCSLLCRLVGGSLFVLSSNVGPGVLQ